MRVPRKHRERVRCTRAVVMMTSALHVISGAWLLARSQTQGGMLMICLTLVREFQFLLVGLSREMIDK